MFLKWENELLGIINPSSYEVKIVNPYLNPTVERLFQGKSMLSSDEFRAFLEDRIVSRERRDIEKILYRCGLSRFHVFKIAEFTRAFNVKDKCWIAFDMDEKFEDCVDKSLGGLFFKSRDLYGNPAGSPGGQQIKRYGFFDEKFGIYKKRLNPLSTDVESEVAVCLFAKKMGVPCCPATKVDDETVFSEYLYDFNKESFVHFRYLFKEDERIDNAVDDILAVRPQYETELFQMLVLDFITHQDDRHLSNYAIKISGAEESFYPLYDNGRSLFYLDSEMMVWEKCTNPILYCNTFGPIGTQWDALVDMLNKNPDLAKSVNLDISDEEISSILKAANISGYRYEGAKVWVQKSIICLKELILNLEVKKTFNNENKENQGSEKVPLVDQIQSATSRAEEALLAAHPKAKEQDFEL